jgi:hypothetical protein
MNDVALRVTEDLNLDMPGSCDQLLEKNRTVAERRGCFALTARERRAHLVGPGDSAHTTTTASRRRF